MLRIGPLGVNIDASQVVELVGQTTLRLIRVRESQVGRLKQTLGVLVKTHEQATGERVRVLGIVLTDGSEHEPTGA